jgi:hypothetical protein
MKKLVFVLLLLFQTIVSYSQWRQVFPKDEFGDPVDFLRYVYSDRVNNSELTLTSTKNGEIIILRFDGRKIGCTDFYNLNYRIKGEEYKTVFAPQINCKGAVLISTSPFKDSFNEIFQVLKSGKPVVFRWEAQEWNYEYNQLLYKGEPLPKL